MTGASALLAKVLRRQLPARILTYGLLNKLNFWTGTGNRRFEFERLYIEHEDPWNYRSSAYEQRKYQRTLAEALRHRKASRCAIELGCSVGVFTAMLGAHFDRVVGVDISQETLGVAQRFNDGAANISFVRGAVPTLSLGVRADVIFCAEILYYLGQEQIAAVGQFLRAHLAQNGIVILVAGLAIGDGDSFYFRDWEEALSPPFQQIFAEDVEDPERPYRLAVLALPTERL